MFNRLFNRTNTKDSAAIAKQRLLQVKLWDPRGKNNKSSVNLDLLQRDLLAVVQKHAKGIDLDQIKFELAREDNHSTLELNVTLPDDQK